MKKKLFLLILIVFIAGCSRVEIVLEQPSFRSRPSKVQKASIYRNALFSNEVQSWVVSSPDPYDFSNYREALSSISELEAAKLLPTHYAVTVYPKSEEEQSKLEADDELKVAYIPFNYRCVPPQVSDYLDATLDRSSHLLTLPSKYKERFVISNNEGEQREVYFSISPLYIVWPVSYPFPEGLDYTIDYSVFLPKASINDTCSFASLAEIESIRRCSFDSLAITRDCFRRTISGTVVNYDNLLDSNLAMANLMIRFQLGSSIIDTSTDTNGDYLAVVPDSYQMSCVYSQPRWKLTESNSTAPITKVMANVSGLGNGIIHLFSNIESTVYRAAYCYFSENHPIDVPTNSTVLRIIMTRTTPGWMGCFTTPLIGTPYIEISDSAASNSGRMFANVCHELGHYTQYYIRNNYLWYITLHSIIKESFASYISWRISHYYYTAVGGVDNGNTFSWDYYFGQDQQYWKKTKTSNYSPMFVDLYDNYNQGESDSSYNYDTISSVPNSIIISLATNNSNWGQIKNQLQNYIGLYFSQSDYNQYISPYDYFLANN